MADARNGGGSTRVCVSKWRHVSRLDSVVKTLRDLRPSGDPEFVEALVTMKSIGPHAASQVLGLVMECGANREARIGRVKALHHWEVPNVGCPYGRWDRNRLVGEENGRYGRVMKSLSDQHWADALDMLAEGGQRAPLSLEEATEAVQRLFPPSQEPIVAVSVDELRAPSGMSRIREALAGHTDSAWHTKVKEAIKAGPSGAAPGVTGLRSGWLQKLVLGGSCDTVMPVLADWVEGMLLGGADAITRTVRLSLIPKPAGGYRPICVGEALANVAKRLALQALEHYSTRALIDGGQWLNAKDGCRTWAKGLRYACDAGWSLMSVDVRNAFNCVNRSAVAEVVTAIAPNVAPFISWACLQPLPMIVNGNHEVQVTRGVLQGDPLASTLFALVMVKVMRRVVDVCASKGVTVVLIQPRDDVPAHVSLARLRDTDVGMGAYADDCTFAWKCPASAKVVMELLESELASVGLDLSRPKCVIVCGAGADASVVEAAAADMQVRVEDVANILGVPYGSTDAARELLMTRGTP